MNKLILIKTNVNMKQIESIKVGVGGEILSAEVKTISAEQFCQIMKNFISIMKIKIGHFQEIRFL